MGCIEVESYFAKKNVPHKIIYLEESSATVELAAAALGEPPEKIAKTLSFQLKDGRAIVIVVSGTSRIDNHKFKELFGCKATMLRADEALRITGHPVGGVCPFALPDEVAIYLDRSLLAFDIIYPAAGSGHSAVRLTPQELAEITGGIWVDVTKVPEIIG